MRKLDKLQIERVWTNPRDHWSLTNSLTKLGFHVGHLVNFHVGHNVQLHVGHHVSHHVGHQNVISTLCEGSEILTEQNSEKYHGLTDPKSDISGALGPIHYITFKAFAMASGVGPSLTHVLGVLE